MRLPSRVHLYWNQFICIVCRKCALGLARGESPRGAGEEREESIYGLSYLRRREGEKNTKRRGQSTNCEITIPIPSRGEKKKSLIANQTANERSSANQIAYLNHLGNIQQLIKHPARRPRFHILSWRTVTQAEALSLTMRDVTVANVSLRKMREPLDLCDYCCPCLYLRTLILS